MELLVEFFFFLFSSSSIPIREIISLQQKKFQFHLFSPSPKKQNKKTAKKHIKKIKEQKNKKNKKK